MVSKKIELINDGIAKGMIGKMDKPKYMKHMKHHTLRHLMLMINSQSGGKTFSEAHKVALSKGKKKARTGRGRGIGSKSRVSPKPKDMEGGFLFTALSALSMANELGFLN
tara:strand:+ start:15949 stop:16278 length:330 start_codon:yes stop_codon:yes gene_type:complete